MDQNSEQTAMKLKISPSVAELRADREVVLAAVRHDDRALQYAAPELWLDSDLWEMAMEQKLLGAIPYRGEPDPIVLAAISLNPAVYDQLDAGHKADAQVRLLAGNGVRHGLEQ